MHDDTPVTGAILSLAALCASFVYTASYRFLRELIDIAAGVKKIDEKRWNLRMKIAAYYIFSDFILDYVYGGSLFTLAFIFVVKWEPDSLHGVLRYFIPIVWIMSLIVIIVSPPLKIIKNREDLRKYKVRLCMSFLCILPIITLEIKYCIFPMFYSCFNRLRDIINLLFPKFMALSFWLVLGLIWKPFSAYAKIKGFIKIDPDES